MDTTRKKPAPSGTRRTRSQTQARHTAERKAPQSRSGQKPRTGTAAGPKRRPARTAAPKPQRKTQSQARRKVARSPERSVPEVVYTPPKPFNRNRLVLQLATVVAVVLALTFGISIFFKVDVITVSGAQKYDAWTVKEASGIEIGDNLLTFGEAKAAGKIRTALPYVDTVRIGIKLPDTVNIEIKELDVVYAVRDSAEQWWLVTSDGRVVDKADVATAGECTQILGVKLASPVSGQQAVAQELPAQTNPTDETGVTVPPVVVRESDKLSTALSILQYLEECGIIGEAANVDVSDLGNLQLRYGQRFDVLLGDNTQLLYKIKLMDGAINGSDEANTLKEYDSGVLDISFTIKENQVIYQATQD